MPSSNRQTKAASAPRRPAEKLKLRAGIVGTFDVSNFGDLLFPLLAEHELSQRLPGLELARYSYRQMEPPSWPYSVRSLDQLAEDIGGLDLLLIGGGHLIRFDKEIAVGYVPASVSWHHPTGYWLTPTLLAAATGIPVAWNGVGVSPNTPGWARTLLGLAARSASYLAVRDQESGWELQDVTSDARIQVITDTAFGIRALLPAKPTDRFRSFCEQVGLAGPYIVVQTSPNLSPYSNQVRSAIREARAQGCAVLELPISPILGDRCGALDLEPPTLQAEPWPDPLLLAEIVSRAEAVLAQSLHLSIVALACGVPVHRPRYGGGSKYQLVEAFQGVHLWEPTTDGGAALKLGLGRTTPGPEVTEALAQLATHWDAIARLPQQARQPNVGTLAAVLNACTGAAEQSAASTSRGAVTTVPAADQSGSASEREDRGAEIQELTRVQAHQEQRLNRLATEAEAAAREAAELRKRVAEQDDQIRELLKRADIHSHVTQEARDLLSEFRGQLMGHDRYYELIARVRNLVQELVPEHATVLVVSKGDDQLISFGTQRGWHFPQDATGVYAGAHPADSDEAIACLEALRARGAQYLLFPQTSFWWFDSYPEFKTYLARHYRLLAQKADTGVVFALNEAPPAEVTLAV